MSGPRRARWKADTVQVRADLRHGRRVLNRHSELGLNGCCTFDEKAYGFVLHQGNRRRGSFGVGK
ncbi:MAG: hypothetical protein ABSG01_00370 [Anaerolineales bacterium]